MSIQVKVWNASTLPPKWIEERRRISWKNKELEAYVESIIIAVRERGDAALLEFEKRFDNVDLIHEKLCVTRDEIEEAYTSISEKQISVLKFMKEKIETFERHFSERINFTFKDSITIRSLLRPIENVGCYVPGGEAAYPSSLIMSVVPAKIAKVPRVAVCTPPAKRGTINPLTLVAADLCKVDEIYKLGGAQAIAALAYGTKSVKPVRKIVGAGNKYVTMAKLLVSRDVAIDMLAGPSEIIVLADKTANPKIVALDMVSQAEHSSDSIAGLVTTSKELAKNVADELNKLAPSLRRSKIICDSLSKQGFIIICQNIIEAINFTNKFAPEHLEVITKNPMDVIEEITSAGLILMGPYAPASASDYCIGTNHILPTSGYGHIFSGLSVIDFMKRINCIEGSKKGLLELKDKIQIIAEAEKLPNHFLAVEGRFKL